MQLRFFLLATSASIRCSYGRLPSLHWPLEPPRCSRPQWCWDRRPMLWQVRLQHKVLDTSNSPGVCPHSWPGRQASHLHSVTPLSPGQPLFLVKWSTKAMKKKAKLRNPRVLLSLMYLLFSIDDFPWNQGHRFRIQSKNSGSKASITHHCSGFSKSPQSTSIDNRPSLDSNCLWFRACA